MEITLEKIELVKDRTGVTYAEAKQALEEADGSVVDAIIAIEETVNAGEKKRGFGEQGEALFSKLKALVKKGNVARIQVKRDGDVILNAPVNAGIVGVVIAPLASVVALVAAFGFKCDIEVVKTDGTIIDISDAVSDTVSVAIEKGSDAADILKDKGKDYYEKASAKGKEYYEKAKDAAEDSEILDKAMDKAKEAADKAKEVADNLKKEAAEVAEEASDRFKKEAEEFDVDDIDDDEEDVEVEVDVVDDEAEAAEAKEETLAEAMEEVFEEEEK